MSAKRRRTKPLSRWAASVGVRGRLPGRQLTRRDRGGDGVGGAHEVGRRLDLRQGKRHGPLLARRDETVEAHAHRRGLASHRHFDGLLNEQLALAVYQRLC